MQNIQDTNKFYYSKYLLLFVTIPLQVLGPIKIHSTDSIHPGKPTYMCPFCCKKNSHHGHMKRHILTHTGEKPYACEFCDSRYNRTELLNRHLRVVHHHDTINQQFQFFFLKNKNVILFLQICPFCYKTISHGHMRRHIRTHTGEKPYICRYCSSRYNRKELLTRHIRSVHAMINQQNQ